MKKISNQGMIPEENLSARSHKIKIATNQFIKLANEQDIPVFVAYYVPKKGYEYACVLPEDVDDQDVESEYGRFLKFFQVCIDFNKEDYKPVIQKKMKDK